MIAAFAVALQQCAVSAEQSCEEAYNVLRMCGGEENAR